MSDEMRELERASIREFVEANAILMSGRLVLDLGCGLQPYRDVVERAGGKYVGFDRPYFSGSVVSDPVGMSPTTASSWDIVLCTQVIQYVKQPGEWLLEIRDSLSADGCLLMTGPTNWPVVEQEDLRRYTPAGITYELEQAGFSEVKVSPRASRNGFLLGWGAVACS
jgi:SAM-dependent methyltransferase